MGFSGESLKSIPQMALPLAGKSPVSPVSWLENPPASHMKLMFLHLSLHLSENVVYPKKPNGFADHYPYFLWLFHWGIPHFQTPLVN